MITDRIVIDAINKKLFAEYRTIDYRAIYRIVWAPDQLEIRKGKTAEFYGSIFIREHVGIKEIKKYWYLNTPCWVLEKLLFIRGYQALKDICEELVEAGSGVYEPIYTFVGLKKGTQTEVPLPVTFQVIDFILNSLHNPTRRTPSDYEEIQRIEEQEEVEYFVDQLSQNERSPLFVAENSSFVSANQLRFRQEYIETTKERANAPIIFPPS
jgi:hypothetical protein